MTNNQIYVYVDGSLAQNIRNFSITDETTFYNWSAGNFSNTTTTKENITLLPISNQILHLGNITGTGSPNNIFTPTGLFVVGDVAYVVSYDSDALSTFNVSNPRNIVNLGTKTGAGSPNYLNAPRSVYVSGDVAYVTTQADDSLTTFNISNPKSIVHLGNITGTGAPNYLNYPFYVYFL